MANWNVFVLSIIGFLHVGIGQYNNYDKGLIKRRPISQSSYSSPCRQYGSDYDDVDEDKQGRGVLLAAAGGAAVGYYLGMKHQNHPVINNNIYNEYTPPCISVQGGGGWGGGSGGGGGIVGGLLGHHPILSNIVQGGILNGGGLGGWLNGNRPSTASANRLNNNVNWNRAIRQFTRVVRIVT